METYNLLVLVFLGVIAAVLAWNFVVKPAATPAWQRYQDRRTRLQQERDFNDLIKSIF